MGSADQLFDIPGRRLGCLTALFHIPPGPTPLGHVRPKLKLFMGPGDGQHLAVGISGYKSHPGKPCLTHPFQGVDAPVPHPNHQDVGWRSRGLLPLHLLDEGKLGDTDLGNVEDIASCLKELDQLSLGVALFERGVHLDHEHPAFEADLLGGGGKASPQHPVLDARQHPPPLKRQVLAHFLGVHVPSALWRGRAWASNGALDEPGNLPEVLGNKPRRFSHRPVFWGVSDPASCSPEYRDVVQVISDEGRLGKRKTMAGGLLGCDLQLVPQVHVNDRLAGEPAVLDQEVIGHGEIEP